VEPGKKIVQYPHPALRFPARPVLAIDAELRRYAGRMLELMYQHEGLGLAAPQVALPLQLLVMNFSGDANQKDQEHVAVNPVIIDKKGSDEGTEGCLSFPGLYQKVRRAKTVTVRAYDLDGHLYEMTCHELPARLWQHEIDHLHGILFIDKMTTLGKLASRTSLKEYEAEYRQLQKKGEIESDKEIQRQLKEWKPPEPPPLL
jgi:peptide deformylase